MMLKPTLILATFLFLVCAPAPDAATIAEISGNLLSVQSQQVLLAAETSPHHTD